MPPKEKYSDPGLRDKVKEEIHKSDKGGAPGQWSARKAQLMASEYKKKGGGYNQDKESGQDESQKNLQNWGKEEWQTKEGSGEAKKADGTRKRYLPKKAWEEMNEEEKEETEAAKEKGSKAGKQFVANTDKANKSRKKAAVKEDEEDDDDEEEKKEEPKSKKAKTESGAAKGKASKGKNDNVKEDKPASKGQKGKGATAPEPSADKKKTKTGADEKKASEKEKTTDASAEKNKKARPTAEHGEKGSKDRLPKKGQSVFWKAMPGMVPGEVLEILTSETTVEGKKVKASKEAPQLKLKSEKSGKICVHKIDAVFF